MDFPLPEIPVIQVSLFFGNLISIFFRLLLLILHISTYSVPRSNLLFFFFRELFFRRNFPVTVSDSNKLSYDPLKQISPPCSPGPGPISKIISASAIILLSCSTMRIVLPMFFSFLITLTKLLISL